MNNIEIKNAFTYHNLDSERIKKCENIREMGRKLVMWISMLCPESRERDIATDKVREAVMWANAAISCHDNTEEK